ncbi:hypothetical protein [Variovorax sp. KK3]|uniref:hypothetical protein n=1 Tax=Variovorax sp. KK3 TaxID=1855728 RepID=UPI00117C2F17|nr:hypothetical protein [Variovorax sp. KK3]
MKALWTLGALPLAALVSGCAAPTIPPAADTDMAVSSGTWAWRYRTYDIESGIEYPAGRIELSGRPGGYSFRYVLKEPNPCAAGSVAATVSTDDLNTIIIPVERMTGCGVRRFVLRKDGTGGRVDVKVQSKKGPTTWEPEERDRGLTAM